MRTFNVEALQRAPEERLVAIAPLNESLPRSTEDHRADIQGLRAVAVLLVVAFHTGIRIRGGFVGVDVFFVISGFVITSMILRELETAGGLRVRRFYARRARRLLPALATTLLVVAAASLLILSPLGGMQIASRTGIGSSLFSANGVLYRYTPGYFSLSSETNPLLHTWSLAVEEQFYFIFPILVLLAWKVGRWLMPRRSARSFVGIILGAVTVFSFAVSFWATGANSRFSFYASPTRAWEFCVGAVLAVAVPRLLRLNRYVGLACGFIGMVLVGIAALSFSSSTAMPGTAALLPVLGTALVLIAGVPGRRGVAAVLSAKPLVWIGDVSYGWYLWHWPVIVFARVLWPLNPWLPGVLGCASLGLAYLSYRWIENPIRSGTFFGGRRTRYLVAACIALPAAAYLALGAAAKIGVQSRDVENARLITQLHLDVLRGCDNARPLSERVGSNCSWPAQSPRGTVILLGDSNAGQFTEPVIDAAAREHLSLTVATRSSCPFADLQLLGGTTPPESCQRFVSESLAEMKRLRPSLVVLASASTVYVNDDTFGFRNSGGVVAVSREHKAQMLEEGLASVLRQLHEADIPVVVVHTIPHFEGLDLRMCPSILRSLHACAARSLSREDVESRQQLARTAEDGAIATVPNAVGIDFIDRLCTDSHCATERDGGFLYRDGRHLSVSGAMTLVTDFADVMHHRAG